MLPADSRGGKFFGVSTSHWALLLFARRFPCFFSTLDCLTWVSLLRSLLKRRNTECTFCFSISLSWKKMQVGLSTWIWAVTIWGRDDSLSEMKWLWLFWAFSLPGILWFPVFWGFHEGFFRTYPVVTSGLPILTSCWCHSPLIMLWSNAHCFSPNLTILLYFF